MGTQIIMKGGSDAVKAEAADREQAVLAWKGEYEEGDRIIFSLPGKSRFYIIHVNDTMDEAFIYGAGSGLVYEVPLAEGKTSYSPKSFTGERHYLTMQYARDYEIKSYRNPAGNVTDQHRGREYYPHAHTNAETRGEAVFAARNTIDGATADLSHGKWPYELWGINVQDGAQMTLEFDHPVDSDQITLYARASFPRDNWWEKVTFTFSDGTSETVESEKSVEPHIVNLERRDIAWFTFGQLIKADDPSPFLALTRIEVYGRGHGAALQGSTGSGMKETE